MSADGSPIYTDPKYFRDYGWHMSGTVPTVQLDPAGIAQYSVDEPVLGNVALCCSSA